MSESIKAFDHLASLYQERFMDFDLYNDSYDFFCDSVKTGGAHVLELGCGPGNITRYILNKRPDLNILGLDLAPNMIALAKQNVPLARFEIMNIKDIGQLDDIYDAIVSGFCMPYLSKEENLNLLKDIQKLLNPNGILYLSTIAGDYDKSAYETSSDGQFKTFVHYYSERDVQNLLEKTGFRMIQLFKKKWTNSKGITSTHLIFIAEAEI